MKIIKRISLLLLLVAFIAPMGLNGLAFAGKLNEGKLFSELDGKPSSWYKKLPASQRFKLVLDNEAVLDKETGLVWERSPGTTTMDWFGAQTHCYTKEVGGRKGWRLPTVEELASLVDTTQANPTLPAGHPFTNVQSSFYWSATTLADLTSNAWIVNFNSGDVNDPDKSSNNYVWCVRGGQGHDGQ